MQCEDVPSSNVIESMQFCLLTEERERLDTLAHKLVLIFPITWFEERIETGKIMQPGNM